MPHSVRLLVGGGVGVPPLYNLAKVLLAAGKRVGVVLGLQYGGRGFLCATNSGRWAATFIVATADGSAGVQGVSSPTAIAECRPEFDYFYACGPLPMLRALCDAVPQDGQLCVRRAHGLRFRGLHGLFVQNQIRQQAHLQGGARINEGGGHMVNKQFIAQSRPAEKPAADMSVSLSGLTTG